MASGDERISDAAITGVLRPFVRATRPLLAALREADPFGLHTRANGAAPAEPVQRRLRDRVLGRLATARLPGTPAWVAMDVRARSRWWVRRVGRLTSLVAAVPGLGGVITRHLPLTDTLGAASEGLVLVAIAGEYGVTDESELVALLGAVLFRRDLQVTPRTRLSGVADAEADVRAAELTGDIAAERHPPLRRVAAALWRLGRALLAVSDELDKRPHGRWHHELMSNLPVVGVAGKYLGEWSGLKRAARDGEAWLRLRRP